MSVMVRKQVYIEPRQEKRLKQRAAETGLSEAEIIRRAIDHWLEEEVRQRQAEQAWQKARQYQAALADLTGPSNWFLTMLKPLAFGG